MDRRSPARRVLRAVRHW